MKTSVVLHIGRGDRIDTYSGEASHYVLITGPAGEDVPVYAHTPEQFEALAAAALECASRMRGRPPLEQILERAG